MAEQFARLGATVICCPDYRLPWKYAAQLMHVISRFGPFDIVHSHVENFSGYVLLLAMFCRIPVRIAHSHSNAGLKEAGTPPMRRLYVRIMKLMIRFSATRRVAVSRDAGESMFGRHPGAFDFLPCGVVTPATEDIVSDSCALRESLGIPAGRAVVGHVGRFSTPKNHVRILSIAAECQRSGIDAHFLLVGDGPLRSMVETEVENRGLSSHFTFAGRRSDVLRLYLHAMDVFLFPSHSEGLGLVLIEAQSCGLPCVISHVIPQEADVIPRLIHRVALASSDSDWCSALAKALAARPLKRDVSSCCEAVASSPFGIKNSASALWEVYGC